MFPIMIFNSTYRYKSFILWFRLLKRLRPSVTIIIVFLTIPSIICTTVPKKTANSAISELKASRLTKSVRSCGNTTAPSSINLGKIPPVATELRRERQRNTTSTFVISNNQTTLSNTTERCKEDRKRNKKRNKIVSTKSSTFGTRNAIISTTKKRSVRTSTILRLQREWQQMIVSGVAYDWYNQKPIRKRTTSIAADDNIEPQSQQLTSHIWIGPISKHQWYIWHFTFTCHDIGNVNDNPYYHGVYHGRIVLSKEYPLRPPISIQLYTPNGRFITNQNICFTSITHYHPDQWNTNSNIYSMIESLRYHMVTSQPGNEIGAIAYATPEQKQLCAIHSQSFRKYIPVQHRHSTKSTIKTTSNTLLTKRDIVIDHGHIIQKGYVTVPPRLDTVKPNNNNKTTTLTTIANMYDDIKDAHDDKSISVSTFTVVSTQIDHLVAPKKRKKKKKATTRKTKAIRKNKVTARSLLSRRRRSLNALLRQQVYYQCGVCLLAFFVLSSSLFQPFIQKIVSWFVPG